MRKGIKVETITGIGIGIRAKRGMITEDEKMTTRRRMVFMFLQGIGMLILESKRYRQNWSRVKKVKRVDLRGLR